MKKIVSTLIAISILLNSVAYGVINHDELSEDIGTIVAGDMETGDVAYRYNMNNEVAIASITKVMTYLVIMDEIKKGNGSLKEIITIDDKAPLVDGSSFYLKEGEKLSVEMLIESILIVSANDSCVALASHFAGSEKKFIKKMNDKAKEIGIESAKFYSVNGLPDEKKGDNTMMPKDILKMSAHVLKKYPEITKITSRKELIVPERQFEGKNTNNLLKTMQEVDGLKTGFTDAAKHSLVSTAVRKDGIRIIAVVMGGETTVARDMTSENVLKMLEEDFNIVKVHNKKDVIYQGKIGDSKNKTFNVYAKDNIEFFTYLKKEDIKKEIAMKDNLKLPLKKGQVVGTVTFTADNIEKKSELIVKEDISRIGMFFRSIRNAILG